MDNCPVQEAIDHLSTIPPSRQFLFVNSNDPDSQKHVRTHVMHDFMREHRWRRLQKVQHPHKLLFRWSSQVREVPPKSKPQPHRLSQVPESHEINMPLSPRGIAAVQQRTDHSGPPYQRRDEGTVQSRFANSRSLIRASSPQTVLRPDPVDPFANFPLRLDRTGQSVVHHCKSIQP